MTTSRVDELIEIFDRLDDDYKRHEVEEALTLRAEIVPRLIDILEAISNDPARYAEEEHFANCYAAALLAHFQEPAAHLPIIRAFCIPKEPLDQIWGDMVTETLPALLCQTCNGDLTAIKELIRNREADDYVRGSAVTALAYAVVKGMIDREGAVAFLAGLLTGTEADEDSYFWGDVVGSIHDLHPEGAMPEIRKAYEEGLVYPGHIGLEMVEEALAREREVSTLLRTEVERITSRDVHGYISWFACFREKPASLPRQSINCALKRQRNKKQKNRVRNKNAKKTRKKNRR